MSSFFGRKSHLLPSSSSSFSSSSSLLPSSRLPSRSVESMTTVGWHMNAYRGRSHELDLLQQLERRPEKLDEQDILDLTLSVGPSAFRKKIELGQRVKNNNNDDDDDNARSVKMGCSNNMCECEGKKCGNTNGVAVTRSDAGGGSGGLVAAPVVTSTRGGLLKMYPHKVFDFGGGTIRVTQQVRQADDTTNIGDVRAPGGMEAISKRKIDLCEASKDGPLAKKVYERQESSGKSRDPRSIWEAYKQQSLYSSMNQDSKVDRQTIQSSINEGDRSVQPPMIQISDDDESSEDTLDVVVEEAS